MFGPPGRLYVYFTYGMWHCANIVCEQDGTAAAVLLRAAALLPEPGRSEEEAAALRMSGPGLLCRSLGLDRSHSGLALRFGEPGHDQPKSASADDDAVYLYYPPNFAAPPVSWTTRVGFSFQDTLNWRCYWTGHPAVGKVSLRPLRRKGQDNSD
jgi:DNA-3-methyladenine glycosylase